MLRNELSGFQIVRIKEYAVVEAVVEPLAREVEVRYGQEVAFVYQLLANAKDINTFAAAASRQGFAVMGAPHPGLPGLMIKGKEGIMIVNAWRSGEIETVLYQNGRVAIKLRLFADGTRGIK